MLSPKVVRMPSPVQTPRNLADIVHRKRCSQHSGQSALNRSTRSEIVEETTPGKYSSIKKGESAYSMEHTSCSAKMMNNTTVAIRQFRTPFSSCNVILSVFVCFPRSPMSLRVRVRVLLLLPLPCEVFFGVMHASPKLGTARESLGKEYTSVRH